MKVYYSNLLTKLTGIVGVTSISLLMGLSARANSSLNPNPSVFTEAPNNRSQRVLVSSEANKNNKSTQILLAQSSRPSIFDECPYNRAACGNDRPRRPAPLPPTTPGTISPPPQQIPTQPPTTRPSTGTEKRDIIGVASSNSSFTMLTKALEAADLVNTLKGNGPFTVFAPSDEAFAKLPQDAVRDLLKPENKEVLVKILTYHVVSGRVLSTDLASGEVTSIEGGPISVQVDPATGIQVNDATVVTPDIEAKNGIIHIINNVILPPDL